MAKNLVPYGLLPNGNYGINLDNTTGDPLATALEVLDTLPSVADPDNTPGRLVFSIADATIFLYINTPTTQWVALEGVPAEVGLSDGAPVDPKPPVTGSEVPGALYWTTDTEVLFVWDGLQWQATGGRYATNVIEKRNVGDDVTVSYSLGVSSALPSALVEVFIDGVRQNSLDIEPGTGDYSIVGTGIVFVVPPVLNAEILTRAYDTVQISQTARVFETVTVAGVAQDTFPTGVAGTQPEAIIVTVDGLGKTLGVDYTVTQQDLTVVSITKAFAGDVIATVVTLDPHGITAIGTIVDLAGALEVEYNDTFIVASIVGPSSFTISVLATDPISATPDPILYFSPPFIPDEVVFIVPLAGGELVDIKSLKNIVVAPTAGEANTLSLNSLAPFGSADITDGKTGVDLQVKGLVAGSNITIVEDAPGHQITIAASTGANYEQRIGANGSPIVVGESASYVGVLDTTIPGPSIIVDLATCGPGGLAPTPGRKVIIKDEAGLAGTRNIDITGPFAATFDGLATYSITTNRGAVTLVFDNANNWNIVSEKI